MSTLSQVGECGFVRVPCDGRAFCPGGSFLVPIATGEGSLSCNLELGNNDLTCFYSSSLKVCIAHIYFNVFNIRSIWELYLEVY